MTAELADPSTVVAALREVPGVADAGLDGAATGDGVLRLDLDPGVDEAEVALAAGRLLRERFGLSIDAGAVAILEEAYDVSPDVERLQVVRAGRRATVTVALGPQDRAASGEASGPATGQGVLKTVAEATLRAIAGRDATAAASLDSLELTGEGASRRVRVCLRREPGGGGLPELIAGAAVVRQDPRQAVIRAVLAALGPAAPSAGAA